MVAVMVMESASVCVTTGCTEEALPAIAVTAAASAVRGGGSPRLPVASSWKTAVKVTVPEEISFHVALWVRIGMMCW